MYNTVNVFLLSPLCSFVQRALMSRLSFFLTTKGNGRCIMGRQMMGQLQKALHKDYKGLIEKRLFEK